MPNLFRILNATSIFISSIFTTTALAAAGPPDLDWYTSEVNFIAGLKSRVTGSPNHNILLDHIESQLQSLGLQVQSESINFTYNQILGTPKLVINGQPIAVSSAIPYSGDTNATGITGKLVNLVNVATKGPDWSKAAGSIAVVNLTNAPINPALAVTWPGQPAWNFNFSSPFFSASGPALNFTAAKAAGVKAIIYAWSNITSANALGQYIPFAQTYQDIPAVHVAGSASSFVMSSANQTQMATLSLPSQLVTNTTARSLWTIFPGSTLTNESMLITTHTDGVNVIEENGHIALLAQARNLLAHPPRRTTILVFVTGHLHYNAFNATGKATGRWLHDNPTLWKTNLTVAAGSCVEHLGAVHFIDDVANNIYYPTVQQEQETLFASTEPLLGILEREWVGAIPNLTRVNNPNAMQTLQSGEGGPLFLEGIPEVSLATGPDHLLKIWPEDFDQMSVIDVAVVQRQIESFFRVWNEIDGMSAVEIKG